MDTPTTQTKYEDLCLYINGQFLKGGGRKESDVLNPATDEVIGKLPHAGQADLDLALSSAQKAFESWKKSSPIERSRILRKVAELSRARAQEIGRNITMDMGKPLAEGMGVEAARVDNMARFADTFRAACSKRGPFLIEYVI